MQTEKLRQGDAGSIPGSWELIGQVTRNWAAVLVPNESQKPHGFWIISIYLFKKNSVKE